MTLASGGRAKLIQRNWERWGPGKGEETFEAACVPPSGCAQRRVPGVNTLVLCDERLSPGPLACSLWCAASHACPDPGRLRSPLGHLHALEAELTGTGESQSHGCGENSLKGARCQCLRTQPPGQEVSTHAS